LPGLIALADELRNGDGVLGRMTMINILSFYLKNLKVSEILCTERTTF
jgi:hypothetical protein